MSRTAEEQRKLELVLAMYREVLITMDSSQVDRYISPDYVQHSSLAPPGRDRAEGVPRHHPQGVARRRRRTSSAVSSTVTT